MKRSEYHFVLAAELQFDLYITLIELQATLSQQERTMSGDIRPPANRD
jgi:hypothetical protein